MLCNAKMLSKGNGPAPCDNQPRYQVNNRQVKYTVCGAHLSWAVEKLLDHEDPIVNVRPL